MTRSIAILVFSLAFIALSVRELITRGGVSRPRTVSARAEGALLLLQYASRNLPQYARVALVKPRGRWDDAGMLAVAHGQLPRQHAVPASTIDPGGDAPDFVVAIDAPLEDPRFERIYEAPGGSIWKRVR